MIIRHVATQEIKGLWICGLDKKWQESHTLEYASGDVLALHMAAGPIAMFYASNLNVAHAQDFTPSAFTANWWRLKGGLSRRVALFCAKATG